MTKTILLMCSDLKRYKTTWLIAINEPSLYVILLYRIGHRISNIRLRFIKFILLLPFIPINSFFMLLTGIEIPRECFIGKGLRIYHFGCIIFNPFTVIGDNCTLRHGVTIGNKNGEDDVPKIGNNVEIGAGAKIIGRIVIGNNVKIGANAVVLCDVPDDCIAVGVPAKVFKKHNSKY